MKSVIFIARYGGGGLLSYVAPRLLITFGVPIDTWIESLPGWFNHEAAYWLLMFIIGLFIISLTYLIPYFISRNSQGLSVPQKDNQDSSVLHEIWKSKTDPEIALYAYGKYGYSIIDLNQKWAECISSSKGKCGLVATVSRDNLDYYNFGNEFHFVSLENEEIIPIPTGQLPKNLNVGTSIRKGMVLRLMSKDLHIQTKDNEALSINKRADAINNIIPIDEASDILGITKMRILNYGIKGQIGIGVMAGVDKVYYFREEDLATIKASDDPIPISRFLGIYEECPDRANNAPPVLKMSNLGLDCLVSVKTLCITKKGLGRLKEILEEERKH